MLDRRALLALPAALAGASLIPAAGHARAPLTGAASPGVYRFKLGGFEVTALTDGTLGLGPELFPKAAAEPAEAARLLREAVRPAGQPIPTFVNGYLVNTGERLVLIDTGTGPSPAFGPNLGRLPRNLAAAGIDAAAVDTVILTHLHPDHIGGLAPEGRAAFPNAELVASEADFAFWTDEGTASRAPADFQPFFKLARDSVRPYAGRTRRVAGGEIVPGVSAELAPGHTPGHMVVRVASGPAQMLVIGDVIHLAAFQFAKPDWSVAFDADQEQARQTRRRVLDQAAADNLLIAGMHLAFPGLGRVAKVGEAYAFAPEPWTLG